MQLNEAYVAPTLKYPARLFPISLYELTDIYITTTLGRIRRHYRLYISRMVQ